MPHAGSLWARLRLSGRKAARWRFQLAVTQCTLELRGRTLKRPPHRLALLVTRKKRQAHSTQYKWHCSQPSRPAHVSVVVGTNQEPIDFQSTLNSKTSEDTFEDKRWAIVLEEVSKTGQRKPLAQAKLNLAELIGDGSDEKIFKEIQNIEFKGYKNRVQNVKVSLHLAGVLLKTGQATDEDMQSLASMFSTQTLDIGNLDDFSDSLSADSSSNLGAENLEQFKLLTSDLQGLTDSLALPGGHNGTLRSRSSRTSSGTAPRDNVSLQSFGDDSDFGSEGGGSRLSKTLPRNFEPKITLQQPVTPPSERKLKPSPLTFAPKDDDDQGDEEVVGGVTQELLGWVREETRNSQLVNITNLTSSFRSGIAFGVLLAQFRPAAIDLKRLEPRTAKANLKLVLEGFNKAGLDLYGVINVNETASKTSNVRMRDKKNVDSSSDHRAKRESIHSVLFDQKTTWTSFAEFRIETLHDELRKLEEQPDQYSVAVDDILDNLDFDEEDEEVDTTRGEMIRREIRELELENDKSKLANGALLGQLHSSGVPNNTTTPTKANGVNLRKKHDNVADIAPEHFIGKLDADFRNSLKESIEIDEFLELEQMALAEEEAKVTGASGTSGVSIPRLPSPVELSSDEENDDLMIGDDPEFASMNWRKNRLSTVDEVGEHQFDVSSDDDELMNPFDDVREQFELLKTVRRNVLKSIDEETEAKEAESAKEAEAAEKARLAEIARHEAEEHRKQIKLDRQAETLRLAELARNEAEKARLAKIARQEEQERRRKLEAEEARLRVAEIARQERLAEEKRLRQLELARQAEIAQQESLAAERRQAELDRLRVEAEEKRLALERAEKERQEQLAEVAQREKERRLEEERLRQLEADQRAENERLRLENARQEKVAEEKRKLTLEKEEHEKRNALEKEAKEREHAEKVRVERERLEREEQQLKEQEERRREEARRAEEQRRKEAEHQAELVRLRREAEIAEQARLAQVAEIARQEEERRLRQFEAEKERLRLDEIARQEELVRQEAERVRLAEIVRQKEERQLKQFEAEKERLRLDKVAQQEAERVRLAAVVRLNEEKQARQREAARLAELARQDELERQAELEQLEFNRQEKQRLMELARQEDNEKKQRDLSKPTTLVIQRNSIDNQRTFLDTDSSSDDEPLVSIVAIAEDQRKFEENEQRWFVRLQELTEQSIRLEEEQEEVDERALQVEPDYRRAVDSKNAKLESDLTAEWLALIQKRDNLLHQAERVSKERLRVKLELELNSITFEARKVALISDNRKTQAHHEEEEALVEKCMELVQAKNEIDNEIDDIDDEILRQRELHAKQMEQNIIEQKTKAEEKSSYSFGSWKIW